MAFSPFPVPQDPINDLPLVTRDSTGRAYRCSGCGVEGLPDGMWVFDMVRDGEVVGLRMTTGPDTAVIHRCGDTD